MYESPVKMGNGPKFAFTGKSKEYHKNDSPGPGAYESEKQNLVRDKSPSFKMGSSKRSEIVSKNQKEKPGPGQYDDNNKIGKNAKSVLKF